MKFLYPKQGANLDQRKYATVYGNFPLSSYNTWHGGIHVEDNLAPLVAISNARIIAYKLPSDYLFTGHECPEMYSNGFILLQHEYMSPKEQKLRYYSMYHHIASKFDIENNKLEVPDFLSKKVMQVNASNTPTGVRGRSAKKEDNKTRGKEIVLIPKNHVVTRNSLESLADWAKIYNKKQEKKKRTGRYHSYSYTDPFSNTLYSDIHIHSGCLKLVSGETDKYIITHEKETNTLTYVDGVKTTTDSLNSEITDGALLFNIQSSDFGMSKGTCIGVIPKDTEVTIIEGSETEDKKWAKVKTKEQEYDGYVRLSDFTEVKSFADDITTDDIVACDIPVKAGEVVAFVGAFGFKSNENKYSSHVELFTDASDQEIKDFLENAKGDGEEDFRRYKMLEGAKLEPYVKSAKELKTGTPVRVTSTRDEYVRVKVKGLIKVIDKEKHLIAQHNGKQANGKYDYIQDKVCGLTKTRYVIKDESFDTVNKEFNGLLTKGDYVYYYKSKGGSLREIIIEPPHWGEEFWIDKSCLKVEEGQTITFGLETVLESDSCHTYIGEPYEPHENGNTFKKERELSGKPVLTTTDDNGKLWYFIAESYDFKGQCYQHIGWIKADDTHLELINPFVWDNFGFKLYNAGSEYVYTLKDYHNAPNTHDFIDTAWKMIDEDGNGTLTPLEFLRLQRNPYTAERLGKMVVKHKSEWSYDPEKIKNEAKEFYQLGIDLEKDATKKQELEQKRNTELEHLVEKVKNLMFWKELQNTTYTPETTERDKEYETKKVEIKEKYSRFLGEDSMSEESKTKMNVELDALDKEYGKGDYKKETRKLPSSDMLWFFNPNSFVRQMRAMYPVGGNVCESLVWGEKVSCEFKMKITKIASKLKLGNNVIEGSNWLMSIIAFETGGSFSASETNSLGYTGLIQFGKAASKEVGTTQAKLKKMSAEYQLKYVLKYFQKKRFNGKLNTLTDLYLAVNYPAACGKGKDLNYVVYDSSKGAYDANPSFKKEEHEFYFEKGRKKFYKGKEGKSYVWEFKEELETWLKKGGNNKNDCSNGCNYHFNNCSCKMKHIDLRNDFEFIEQGANNQLCLVTCQSIIKRKGFVAEGPIIDYTTKRHAFYQLAIENSTHSKLETNKKEFDEGIKYLNKELNQGRPVIVGVDHTLDGGINNEQDVQTTDHFVIILGRFCLNNEIYYQYWDVGTMYGEKEHYRFKLLPDRLVNKRAYAGRNKPDDSRTFTVTQIRRNIGYEKQD